MEKAVFGWILAGGKLDQAGREALYALMKPTITRLKFKRLAPKHIDQRLDKAFPAFYEYYSLYTSKKPSFWTGAPGGLPEFKALRDLKADFRKIWKDLYPPAEKK